MLNVEILSFREFVMHESLPLAKIQTAVLEFSQGRNDAVLFGAQAVNGYVEEPRATQDVDIISDRAAELAEEIKVALSGKPYMKPHIDRVLAEPKSQMKDLRHEMHPSRKPGEWSLARRQRAKL